jgi:hypothetical protein
VSAWRLILFAGQARVAYIHLVVFNMRPRLLADDLADLISPAPGPGKGLQYRAVNTSLHPSAPAWKASNRCEVISLCCASFATVLAGMECCQE